MSRRQIDAIRARSRAKSDGPWVTDYPEMARKTAIRRLTKFLPMSIELATAVHLDTQAAMGESQALDSVLTGELVYPPSLDDEPPALPTGTESSPHVVSETRLQHDVSETRLQHDVSERDQQPRLDHPNPAPCERGFEGAVSTAASTPGAG
jgi:recombinational DNA repair protein RecT